MNSRDRILAVNRGSSSLKFALYETRQERQFDLLAVGNLERIGHDQARVSIDEDHQQTSVPLGRTSSSAAINWLLDWVASRVAVAAVGHRVVHGGARYREPAQVDAELLVELRRISSFDPDHLPMEIDLMEAFADRFPDLPQVACFDTQFHSDLPRVARILPVPRRLERAGVVRYGFHGLSFEYLLRELRQRSGDDAANGRVILAHLGAGASMAAVLGGRSIDTTMAFTPTAGLPMSTRSGDLDPGLVSFLARSEGMTAQQFHDMVNHESGLLGVSETSGDVRDLLACEGGDVRAAEALALFCYQTKKWIGAFVAALGGLDTLVFSAGIGEHASLIRARICQGLECFGIELDSARNQAGSAVISSDESRVSVHVMHTDEELMIAQATGVLLSRPPMP